MRGLFAGLVAGLAVFAAIIPATAHVQLDEDNTEVTVNYVYATQLGIGCIFGDGLEVLHVNFGFPF